jgi:hypothetical protein
VVSGPPQPTYLRLPRLRRLFIRIELSTSPLSSECSYKLIVRFHDGAFPRTSSMNVNQPKLSGRG